MSAIARPDAQPAAPPSIPLSPGSVASTVTGGNNFGALPVTWQPPAPTSTVATLKPNYDAIIKAQSSIEGTAEAGMLIARLQESKIRKELAGAKSAGADKEELEQRLRDVRQQFDEQRAIACRARSTLFNALLERAIDSKVAPETLAKLRADSAAANLDCAVILLDQARSRLPEGAATSAEVEELEAEVASRTVADSRARLDLARIEGDSQKALACEVDLARSEIFDASIKLRHAEKEEAAAAPGLSREWKAMLHKVAACNAAHAQVVAIEAEIKKGKFEERPVSSMNSLDVQLARAKVAEAKVLGATAFAKERLEADAKIAEIKGIQLRLKDVIAEKRDEAILEIKSDLADAQIDLAKLRHAKPQEIKALVIAAAKVHHAEIEAYKRRR